MPKFALRYPYFIIMACLVVLVVGVTTVFNMPVDLFPKIDMPVVVVATFYSGMPPQQIEADITDTFERFFTLGSNIDHIESRSLTGVSLIKIYFKPGTDSNASPSSVVVRGRPSVQQRQPFFLSRFFEKAHRFVGVTDRGALFGEHSTENDCAARTNCGNNCRGDLLKQRMVLPIHREDQVELIEVRRAAGPAAVAVEQAGRRLGLSTEETGRTAQRAEACTDRLDVQGESAHGLTLPCRR